MGAVVKDVRLSTGVIIRVSKSGDGQYHIYAIKGNESRKLGGWPEWITLDDEILKAWYLAIFR